LLRRHGKSIADRQHDLKRIADIGIDLYVGLCVLSRAAALSRGPGEQVSTPFGSRGSSLNSKAADGRTRCANHAQ